MVVKLRTPAMSEQYGEWLSQRKPGDVCPLCEREPIKQFNLWKIIPNRFPYDKVAQTHHTLVTLRHVPESQLSDEERAELVEIKRDYASKNYEYFLEAGELTMTLPKHYHIHLVVFKDF